MGLATSRARKVIVSPSLTVLIVPGANGVMLLVPDDEGRFRSAFGGPTESVLAGRPIGSAGPTVFGLASDGVQTQAVALRDGSSVDARVFDNVYALSDPSWAPPLFTEH
jgi:hypothetical protein